MQRRQFVGALAALAAARLAPAAAASKPAAAAPLDATAFHASRRFARLACGNVAYVERGRGEAALFLHGFPLNGFQWRGALERLSPYRRCIAPDWLGLGYSEVAAGQAVAPADQVNMILALLDTLGIARVDLVANDSGGAIAQLLLAQHGARVRSLLLTNCDSEIESPPAAMAPVIELAKKGEFADRWLAPWLADKRLARSAEGIGGMCYADPSAPSDAAIDTYFTPLLASARSKALLHGYAIALERNALAGIGPALRRARAPVRLVWGTGDTIFSAAGAQHLAGSFGNFRGLRELPGSKLFWPEERPDVIAAEALALWRVDRAG